MKKIQIERALTWVENYYFQRFSLDFAHGPVMEAVEDFIIEKERWEGVMGEEIIQDALDRV